MSKNPYKQSVIKNQKPAFSQRIRRTGWVACLILAGVLALGGWRAGGDNLSDAEAFRQAMGVRGLLRAGAGLSSEELTNPFVCLREGGNSDLALEALTNLSDEYLLGVGLCMAGKGEAGMAALKEADGHANAEVQYAAGLSAVDPQAGVDTLAGADLADDELVVVLQKMSTQVDVEPYPALRVLAQKANDQPVTWRLWLQGSSRLEAADEWQVAVEWLEEGLAMAPDEVRGSLYARVGRIWQTQADPRDYQAALAAYNQAIEKGGWLSPSDEANIHIYRGEVYRSLKDEFNPAQAIEEFQRALELQPGSYWALLSIGHVYLYDLKEMDQAETHYRQAMATNEKNPYSYFYIGDVYRARGDNETAAEWYRLALERQPDWQPALDRLKGLEGK